MLWLEKRIWTHDLMISCSFFKWISSCRQCQNFVEHVQKLCSLKLSGFQIKWVLTADFEMHFLDEQFLWLIQLIERLSRVTEYCTSFSNSSTMKLLLLCFTNCMQGKRAYYSFSVLVFMYIYSYSYNSLWLTHLSYHICTCKWKESSTIFVMLICN